MALKNTWQLSKSMDPVRFIVSHLRPLLRRPVALGVGEKRLKPQQIGELGERVACAWLWAHGCKVLYRNFRAPSGGEVDIVARDDRKLCFIEVKTRTRRGDGRPADAVDRNKQELVERGAREWLRLLQRKDLPCRYDIIEVFLIEGQAPEVTHLKNAFGHL